MADLDNSIPTLTNITHQGNKEMLNHFDAHQFDDETDEIDSALPLENASDLENTNELNVTELNEIPSIKIDDSTTDNTANIEIDDFSAAMQSITIEAVEQEPEPSITSKDLKEKIDLAITDALPGIETYLKKSLYSKFDI